MYIYYCFVFKSIMLKIMRALRASRSAFQRLVCILCVMHSIVLSGCVYSLHFARGAVNVKVRLAGEVARQLCVITHACVHATNDY